MRRLLALPFGWIRLLVELPLWLPLALVAWLRRSPIVEVELSAPIPEIGTVTGPERFFRKRRFGLWELHALVEACGKDRRVKALSIVFQGPGAIGLGTAHAIARLVRRLRDRGKKVYFSADSLDNRLALIAGAADRVSLPPAAPVYVPGHAVEVFFLRDLLERLGAKAEVVRLAEYKTAADMFAERELSPAHREMLESILEDLQARFLESFARGGRIPPERAREIVVEGLMSSEGAKEAGLVDDLVYPDGREDWIEKDLGTSRSTGAWTYLARRRRLAALRRRLLGRPPRLAVVLVEGVIMPDEAGPGSPSRGVSARRLAAAFEYARESGAIRGVVLRVESPGGSASESEKIWREVSRLAEEKPVVASLGDIAASGGYYLAAAANRILASEGTLTGSIGVLAGKLDLSGALDRLGVRAERLGESPAAHLMSSSTGFSEAQRASLEREIRRCYDLFVERVAKGRKMDSAAVGAVAKGRVWTGSQAVSRGLADGLGGTVEAIEAAREAASIPPDSDVEIVLVRPATPRNWLRLLFSRGAQDDASLPAAVRLLSAGAPLAWWPDSWRLT